MLNPLRRCCTTISSLALLLALASSATAVPKGDWFPEWLQLDAEYRVETLYVDPYELSGTRVRDTHWTEQRLRVDTGVRLARIGGFFVQVDLLDGVLFGDNGDFGQDPEPSSGLAVTSRWPNTAGWDIGVAPGADPLDPDSYGPVLRSIDPIRLRRVYGEAYLPFGLLRVGRQPLSYGAGIMGHEGTRSNRWGVSRYAPTADRVLLATKLDQVVLAAIEGLDREFDTSQERGVFLALAYDWGTQDDLQYSDDDLHQVSVGLQWRVDRADWGGLEWRDLLASVFVAHRFGNEFDTAVWALPIRLAGHIGPVGFDVQYALNVGASREISEGFAELANTPVERQQILGMGAHARVDVQWGPVELTMEVDYASGDDDPRSTTDLTMFTFARDFNVGLLLFEHILAFESARSAGVGIENLSQLGAASFPLTEVATQGRFTNAIALFPQLKVDIVDSPVHRLHTRFGVLVAWPAARGGAVDPIMSTILKDGREIADDVVNFHGGKPGSYYGTELDLQVQWTFRDYFQWTVEGAVLFPGDSLQNRNGVAVTAFLVENRFAFFF